MTEIADQQSEIRERARNFNYWDEELDENPYPLLDEFRRSCPVVRSDQLGGFWLTTAYETAREVLTHPETFSSRILTLPAEASPPMVPESFDPPKHTVYRRLFTRFFTPRRVATLRDRAQVIAAELLDQYVSDGGGDFIAKVAVPFPGLMFVEIADFPAADLDQLVAWKDLLLKDRLCDDEQRRRNVAEVVMPSILAYFDDAIETRLRTDHGQDDLITGLMTGELLEGATMTRDELHNALLLLLVGGLDTVTASLGLAVEYLAAHPEVRRQMIDEPDLIPSAVEEFLRYFALINIHREVVQDTLLGGVQLRRGDYVGVCIPAANRDDQRFPGAGEVDIRRSPNPHLGFGAGPHRCLGSHLARMEMAVAFEEICRRMPDFAITGGRAPRHHFGGVMGIEELHLTIPPCS